MHATAAQIDHLAPIATLSFAVLATAIWSIRGTLTNR